MLQVQKAAGNLHSFFVSVRDRIILTLFLCRPRCRHAAHGFPAEKHPSRNYVGVHSTQLVGITEKHCPGCHPSQSGSGLGSQGVPHSSLVYQCLLSKHRNVLIKIIGISEPFVNQQTYGIVVVKKKKGQSG